MGGSISWVHVSLVPEDSPAGGSATVLRLEHEAVVEPEFWEQYGPGAVGVGWGLGLWSLGEHVVGAPPPAQDDPAYVAVAAPRLGGGRDRRRRGPASRHAPPASARSPSTPGRDLLPVIFSP